MQGILRSLQGFTLFEMTILPSYEIISFEEFAHSTAENRIFNARFQAYLDVPICLSLVTVKICTLTLAK